MAASEQAVTAATAGVGEAMRRVLAAEAQATGSVEDCRRRAQAQIDTARLTARQIADHAESLAQAIHSRIEQVAQRRAACRRVAAADGAAGPDPRDVSMAVARLSARLTGGLP